MNYHHMSLAFILTILLAGCGSARSTPQPTPVLPTRPLTVIADGPITLATPSQASATTFVTPPDSATNGSRYEGSIIFTMTVVGFQTPSTYGFIIRNSGSTVIPVQMDDFRLTNGSVIKPAYILPKDERVQSGDIRRYEFSVVGLQPWYTLKQAQWSIAGGSTTIDIPFTEH